MKALVQRDFTGPDALRPAETAEPVAAPAAVLIEVRAAGICYPDLLMTYGRYQTRPEPPFIPGSEVAGVVLAAPADSSFRPGQDVAAVTFGGGFAERVAVDPARVVPVEPGIDHADAAALLANHQTAHFALARRAALVPGETVLVLGSAGGLGSASVQLAKALGARVIAAVHREGAGEFLAGIGADDVVPLREGWAARVRELTGGRGADIVVDPVGGSAFDEAVRVVAPEGRLVVLGFAGGGIPEVKVNRLLLRNISVVGAGWGEYLRTRPEALRGTADSLNKLVADGLRPPVTARYSLDRGAEALRDLENGQILGKAVLIA